MYYKYIGVCIMYLYIIKNLRILYNQLVMGKKENIREVLLNQSEIR